MVLDTNINMWYGNPSHNGIPHNVIPTSINGLTTRKQNRYICGHIVGTYCVYIRYILVKVEYTGKHQNHMVQTWNKRNTIYPTSWSICIYIYILVNINDNHLWAPNKQVSAGMPTHNNKEWIYGGKIQKWNWVKLDQFKQKCYVGGFTTGLCDSMDREAWNQHSGFWPAIDVVDVLVSLLSVCHFHFINFRMLQPEHREQIMFRCDYSL